MSKKLRSTLTGLLGLGMTLSSVGTVMAAPANDINGHWAAKQLQEWVDKGDLNGYGDGSVKPNQSITRAEFISLVNRMFGYKDIAQISFTDLPAGNWAYADIAKAVSAGYIQGYENNTIRPSANVTRQEAASIISKVLGLQAGQTDSLNQYKDAKQIAAWSQDSISAVISKNIMHGYTDGTFAPQKNLTRAEAVVLLDAALATKKLTETVTYDQAGTYGSAQEAKVIHGNVVINVPGVVLENVEIEGDLTLAAGVGSGDVTLKNVKVHGTTNVQGGGENSIHFVDSVLVNIVINKKDGTVRIVAEGSTTAETVIVQSSAKIEEDKVSGVGFTDVELSKELPANAKVVLNGTFDDVDVYAASVSVQLQRGSIENVHVDGTAQNSSIEISSGAKLAKLVLDAVAKLLGAGQIQTAVINEGAKGSSFQTKPSQTEGAAKDSIIVNTPAPSNSSSGGSTSGGGSSTSPGGGSETNPGGGSGNLTTPAKPNVTNDDLGNTVTGMNSRMEYDLDGAGWVKYNAETFNGIDFSGEHTLKVRIAAVAGVSYPSEPTILIFTTNHSDSAPMINNVSIKSNNTDPRKATVGDTVTLTFTTTEEVSKLSNFKINGSNPTTFSTTKDGAVWTNVATYVIEESDPEGLLSFQINVKNAAGIYSQTIEATSDRSCVTIYHETPAEQAPVISSVHFQAETQDPHMIVFRDTVKLTFITNQHVTPLSNFKINRSNITSFTSVKVSDGVWENTATYLTDDSEPYGRMNFQINVKNDAGLYSITTEETSDGSYIEVMKRSNLLISAVDKSDAVTNQQFTLPVSIQGDDLGTLFYNNKVRYFAFLWDTTSDDITVGSLFGEEPEVIHDGKDGQPLVLAWGSTEGHPLKDYEEAYAAGVATNLPITFHKEGTYVINYSLRALDSLYGGKWVSSASCVTGDVTSSIEVKNADIAATYDFDLTGLADSYQKGELLTETPTGEKPEVFNKLAPVQVKLKELTAGTAYAEKVRIAPVGAENVQLWAKDSTDRWYDINQMGWGSAEGFDIDLEARTDVYVLVGNEADDHVKLTFNLVDAANSEHIVATKKVTANAVQAPQPAATYDFNLTDVAESYQKGELLKEAPTGEKPEVFNKLTPVQVKLEKLTAGTAYADKVRIAPVGAENVQLWAKDSTGQWYDINQMGWGPAEGFDIDLDATTDVYVLVGNEADNQVELTFNLVDAANSEHVVATKTVTANAVQAPQPAATYDFNLTGVADSYQKGELLTEAPTGEEPEVFNKLTPVQVKLKELTAGTAYADKVRIAPIGAKNVQLWAKDSTGHWYDINQMGWGPAEGFDIDLEATTDVYVLVGNEADNQVELTFNLVDAANSEHVVATKTVTANAVNDEMIP